MNALQSFNFEGIVVRVFGDAINPVFIAADICKAIGIQNTTDAIKSLAPFERTKITVGGREINAVNESGLYTLILRSRDAVKEGTAAYRFRIKVTAEILPTIRKTGSYSTTPATIGFDPATLLQKALTGEINVRETASTLASAAALLQLTETLKNISPDVRVEKILQASQAFELVLNGQASLNAADEAFKRQRISERNRANALSGWRKRKETMNACQEKEVQ